MRMRVFVSHSMKDQSILNGISETLSINGIQLLIAEHEFSIDTSITQKIKQMIKTCHIGLILLTKNGIQSGFVREEMGYLEAMKKPTLIVIEKDIKEQYSGFKFGHDHIELQPEYPEKAIEKIKTVMMNHWQKLRVKKERQRQQEEEKIRKNRAIGLGVFAGLLILAARNQ